MSSKETPPTTPTMTTTTPPSRSSNNALRLFLFILLPVGLAWIGSKKLASMQRRFSSSSDDDEGEVTPLLLQSSEKNHPFSYDWDRLLHQEGGGTYYSSFDDNINKNDGRNSDNVVIHAIVLVHGWLGNPLEMNSIQQALQSTIENYTAAQGEDVENQSPQSTRHYHRYVVHSALCNQGKTTDGIDAGGTRLAGEINSLLRYIVSNNPLAKQITLSICGNSLGGLYARRSLADIEWTVNNNNNDDVSIEPMLFVTTATPHLGVSQHTYIRLPRAIEYPIATVLDETGRDLFRFSSVLEELTFQDKYLKPLQSFKQRIAYANVYGTDFQVPTPTAAFWAVESDSPHILQRVDSEDTTPPDTIAMTLTTPKGKLETYQEHEVRHETDPTKRYQEWSQQLDRLGWTKVLCDMREHVPHILRFSSSNSDSSESDDDDEEEGSIQSRSAHPWTQGGKTEFTADELLREFGSGLLESTTTRTTSPINAEGEETKGFIQRLLKPFQLRFPLGHTVMVANAKDEMNRYLTVGGKPVMDWLSKSMIKAIQQQDSMREGKIKQER